MDLHDKELWLKHHGRVIVYGRIAGFESCMRWTSNGSQHITKVKGEGDDAMHRLFDSVKNILFEMCLDIQAQRE